MTRQYSPDLIVEIGTAFGISGMFWVAGLEINGRGRLVTFEPNAVWQSIAEKNIGLVSSRFTSICSIVENSGESQQDKDVTIDILFH